MTEKTVQVPVSLIEHLARELALHGAHDTAAGLLPLLSQPTPTAKPLRIEDMAPGTTFTARFHWDGTDREFKIDEFGHVMFHVWESPGRNGAIDPSTIRDVTPPKEDYAV